MSNYVKKTKEGSFINVVERGSCIFDSIFNGQDKYEIIQVSCVIGSDTTFIVEYVKIGEDE